MTNVKIPNIDSVVDIAHDAGDAILDIYLNSKFETTTKTNNSPVTTADLSANNIILKGLKVLTENIPILSEESILTPWSDRKNWNQYWLVDPLDGTKEFINKSGEFTVNIALISENIPVLGVVYAPTLKETWIGVEGESAYKIKDNKRSIIKTQPHKDGEIWRVVGSRSHPGKNLNNFLESIVEYELISMGSSLKFCMVAEGRAHIYPRLEGTSEWDTAAAHAVVEAAGGSVLDMDNNPLLYNSKESVRNPYFIVSSIKRKNIL